MALSYRMPLFLSDDDHFGKLTVDWSYYAKSWRSFLSPKSKKEVNHNDKTENPWTASSRNGTSRDAACTGLERKIDCTRLGLCTDIDEVQSYLLELTDEIIEDVRKEQAARQRQQMKDLIRDYWEEIERKGQECVNAYLGQLCRNNAKFEGTLHCNKYEDKRVDITVSHLGMKFICDTFSGKSIASFFQEPTWIK